jgi:hypothetical protein
MKVLAVGILALALATGAGAAAFKTFFLGRGDTALYGSVQCHAKGAGFFCFVGGDYRRRYGVTISGRSVTVERFTDFSHHHTVQRWTQRDAG